MRLTNLFRLKSVPQGVGCYIKTRDTQDSPLSTTEATFYSYHKQQSRQCVRKAPPPLQCLIYSLDWHNNVQWTSYVTRNETLYRHTHALNTLAPSISTYYRKSKYGFLKDYSSYSHLIITLWKFKFSVVSSLQGDQNKFLIHILNTSLSINQSQNLYPLLLHTAQHNTNAVTETHNCFLKRLESYKAIYHVDTENKLLADKKRSRIYVIWIRPSRNCQV